MIHKNQKKNFALFMIKVLIVLANTGIFAAAWYMYYREKMWVNTFYNKGDYAVIALYLIIYAIMAKIYDGLALRISRISELIYSQVIAVLITTGIMYIVILLLTRQWVNIMPLLLEAAISCTVCAVWSFVANKLTNIIYKPARIFVVYDNDSAYKNGKYIIEKLVWRFEAVGEYHIPDIVAWYADQAAELDRFSQALEKSGADCVMLCGLASSQRNDILKYCIENDVKVFVRPNIGDFIMSNAQIVQMANLPVLVCEKSAPSLFYTVTKRVMDIVISVIGIVITSPILLITAIAIKLYDGGPVFYKQVRLTHNGKKFNILKFRSMKVDAEKDGVARLSSQGDSRITPVGRFIRACRIDELPQLFNIIGGSLSIVGPRPERPEIAEEYAKEMPEFSLRLQVKAGLTGYAQVYGKYNTEPYDKLQMDLLYISRLGIATDFKIILATIKVLFMPESTEGIASGQTTAKK